MDRVETVSPLLEGPKVRIRLLPKPPNYITLFSIGYMPIWQTYYSGLPLDVPILDIALAAKCFLRIAAV